METTSTSARLQIDPNPQRTSGITHCCEPQVDRSNEWNRCVRVLACMCVGEKEGEKWEEVLGMEPHCTLSTDWRVPISVSRENDQMPKVGTEFLVWPSSLKEVFLQSIANCPKQIYLLFQLPTNYCGFGPTHGWMDGCWMDRWMDGCRWFFARVERGARSIRKCVSWLCAAWLLCWFHIIRVFVSLKLLPITLCLLVLYLSYHSMLPYSPLNAVLLCAKIDYSQCCSSVFCCFIWLSHVSWYCWPVILLLCIFCCFLLICMGCESWVHCCFKIFNDTWLWWMDGGLVFSTHAQTHTHKQTFKKIK